MHVTVGAYRSQGGRLFVELHFILCGCWELGADAFQEQGMFSPAPLNKSIGKDSMVSRLDIMTRVKGLLSFLSHCMRDQVAALVNFLKIQVSTVFPEKVKILIWIIISILRKGKPEILPQIQWCHCSAFKPKLMLPPLPILWSVVQTQGGDLRRWGQKPLSERMLEGLHSFSSWNSHSWSWLRSRVHFKAVLHWE